MGPSREGMLMFSDGASAVGIKIRLPLRMSWVQRIDEWALKRASLQGMMIWIESGTMIGLVERRAEYHESRKSKPIIILVESLSRWKMIGDEV
jgi:hypothetical protein